MKTTQHLILLSGLLAIVALSELPNVPGLQARTDATEAESERGAHRTSFLVRVRTDTALLPMDFETLKALLRCDAVAGRASIDVLDISSRRSDGFFNVEPVASGEKGVVQLALDVHLPVTVKGVAVAFGNALVENLRVELGRAFQDRIRDLEDRLDRAKVQVEAAERDFREILKQGAARMGEDIELDPADEVVYRQLERTVDLSSLTPEMPLSEAIRRLSHSVEPPLKIVVLWRELLDTAEIEPSAPIDIHGPAAVRLDTGLRVLLNGVAGGFTQLDYAIDAGVITVASIDGLPTPRMEARVHCVPALVRAMGQTRQLARMIPEVVQPESWYEMTEFGEGTIKLLGDAKLLIWQTRPIHREIQQFLRRIATDFPVTLPIDVSQTALNEQMQLLRSYRDKLQAELDHLQEQMTERERVRSEMEEQYNRNSWDSLHADFREIAHELGTLRREIAGKASNSPSVDEIDRIIVRARACMERSNEHPPALRPFTLHDMGSLWHPSPEVAVLMKRLSSQQAVLEAVTSRIAQVDRLLVGPQFFDTDVNRIQRSARRLQEAIARVDDWEPRLLNPEASSVTILGAID